jgi:4-nitrophenyl phosphatase
MKLNQYQAFVIDMDGVLWRGHTFLPGVTEFFTFLRDHQMPFILATNNATAIPKKVVERLSQIDVEIEPDEVLTSSMATANYLRQRFQNGARVLAIGETAVRDSLTQAGFDLTDEPDGVEIVVVGFDREISWYKLTKAALAVQAGALFVGTNPDLSFPIEQGQAPGNGAFVKVIEVTTGTEPLIIGKPEPLLFEQAAEKMGLPATSILAVGDRLETDILGGQRAGMGTALLLTGVTSSEYAAASEIQPDWTFQDLPALTEALRAERK